MFPGHWTRLRACYEPNNDVIGLRKRGRRNRPRLAREYEKETERGGGERKKKEREFATGEKKQRHRQKVRFVLSRHFDDRSRDDSRTSVSRSSITTFVARSVCSVFRWQKRTAEEKYRDRFDRTDGRGLIEMYGTVSEIRSYASSPRA